MVSTRRPTRRAQVAVMVVAVLIVALGVAIWSRTTASDDDTIRLGDDSGEIDPASTNPPMVGSRLPDSMLATIDGESISLESDGRPMVVNMWHRNCGPCARELQVFAAMADEFGDEVRFVGVDPLDEVDEMVEFAEARGVGYELLRDIDLDFTNDLRLTWYPATLFVAADGEIVAQTGEVSESELRAHVEHLLAA